MIYLNSYRSNNSEINRPRRISNELLIIGKNSEKRSGSLKFKTTF